MLFSNTTKKALALLPYIKAFWRTYRFLKRSQYWDKSRLEEYQLMRLRHLLEHAYKNVPYYKKVFNELGLKPKDIQDFKDMQKLPFLTKDIVRKKLNELKAKNYDPKKFEYVTTGGSTGKPLGFYYERGVCRAIEWAFIKTLWDRVGYHFTDKCVVLRGNVVKSAEKGKYWEYSLFGRWLILSSFHMTNKNLPKYIEIIRKFKPRFIQAYPSAITILARYMKENSIPPFSSVKAILCGSESLYPWQRKLLEEVFQCRVFSWYGHSEMCVLAGECEKSTYYHIFPEYGIVELIGKDGRLINRAGEIGEIVATGFNNYTCPFIRYHTGDLATLSNVKCKCGRNYPLLTRIEGRVQEFIVASDGSLIPLGPVIFGIHEVEWTKVKEIQFLQETPGELIIRVVKSPSYSDEEVEAYILKLFRTRLGGMFKLSVVFVDHIPRTLRGKYRYLIQKLSLSDMGLA